MMTVLKKLFVVAAVVALISISIGVIAYLSFPAFSEIPLEEVAELVDYLSWFFPVQAILPILAFTLAMDTVAVSVSIYKFGLAHIPGLG
jgi:hypothetical protein